MNQTQKIICCFCIAFVRGWCQDVESIARDTKKAFKEEPVSLKGSIGLNSVFYQANGIAPRRDPFYWVMNANSTLLLFGKITVPFTAIITSQNKSFTNGLDQYNKPFNQFGVCQ